MKRKVYVKQLHQLKAAQATANQIKKKAREMSCIPSNTPQNTTSVIKRSTRNSVNKNSDSPPTALPNVGVLMRGSSSSSRERQNCVHEEPSSSGSSASRVTSEQRRKMKGDAIPTVVEATSADIPLGSEPTEQPDDVDNAVNGDPVRPLYEAPPSYTYLTAATNVKYGATSASEPAHGSDPDQYGVPPGMNYVIVPSVVDSVPTSAPPQYTQTVLERSTFGDHSNFTHPVPYPSTIACHQEPFEGRSHDVKSGHSTEENGDSLGSTETYSYPNHATTWEQENGRYVSYTWKNHDVDVYNNNNDVSLTNNNVQYNVTSPQEGMKRRSSSHIRDASMIKLSSSSSRRRRKRVQTPVQRSAANMRERRRMCHLNVAFDRLKERLPNVKDKKKLSRIQTLKAAIYYIHLLRDSLNMC